MTTRYTTGKVRGRRFWSAEPREPKFDRYGYSLSPQNVYEWFWYYETPQGIQCVYQPRDVKGNLLFAAPAWTIPWKKIEASMKRRAAAKRKRSRSR